MAREKIQIKKIDNTAARQVTFWNRRRALFKKAQELSILCDADVGLIIFSAAGKLFEYSNTSMQMILEKYSEIPGGIEKNADPKHDVHVKLPDFSLEHMKLLSQQIKVLEQFIEQMNGEVLDGLTINDLQELEEKIENGLGQVRLKKVDNLLNKINALDRKGIQLLEENGRLHQQMRQAHGHIVVNDIDQEITFIKGIENQDPQSSESISTLCNFTVHHERLQDCKTPDTSLELGL